jgi:hypothetical protein
MAVTLGKPDPRPKAHHEPSFVGSKAKTSDEKEATSKRKGLENKELWWEKRQHRNTRGLKIKTSVEKEPTLKRKGKVLWWKKRQPWNARGSKAKTSDKKRGKSEIQVTQK